MQTPTRKTPEAGEEYQHQNGYRYQVIAIARDDYTEQDLVIHKGLRDGRVWSRPLLNFLGDKGGFPRFKGPLDPIVFTHVCPRREENAHLIHNLPEQDQTRADGTCSYCGSLLGDAFMKQVENIGQVTLVPTDKNYKVYYRYANGSQGKFYFQHLSSEQMQRFVELLNAKQLTFAHPGHFYTRPYFIAVQKDA